MLFSLPVIASDFPAWKQIVEENECGLNVDPTNPEKIARAIEYILANPEIATRMGKNGRKAVLERYNWDNEANKLLNIYRNINKLGSCS
jgi:glycosyltransferase involved in cell wall biosynthesis